MSKIRETVQEKADRRATNAVEQMEDIQGLLLAGDSEAAEMDPVYTLEEMELLKPRLAALEDSLKELNVEKMKG